MPSQQNEAHANPGAEPTSGVLRDDIDSQVLRLKQQIQNFSHSVVQRGKKIVAEFSADLEILQQSLACDMPYELRVTSNKKSPAEWQFRWIRKKFIVSGYFEVQEAKYKVSKKTHLTTLYYIRCKCPAAILPLVEKTDAQLVPIRAELQRAAEMFRLIARLQKLRAGADEN